jgi:hypothetical protein
MKHYCRHAKLAARPHCLSFAARSDLFRFKNSLNNTENDQNPTNDAFLALNDQNIQNPLTETESS